MSDSEEVDELEVNEPVENMSVFRKREINAGGAATDSLIEMDAFRKLNNMLTCPICLELFQEPVYVKDCSHRFCKECIEKAIRSSKTKQCPTCRRVIGTKRLLRIDHNVQDMIHSIFGDITKYLEQKQTNEEQLLTQTYSSLATHESNARKMLKLKQESNYDNQAAFDSGIIGGSSGGANASANNKSVDSMKDEANRVRVLKGVKRTGEQRNRKSNSHAVDSSRDETQKAAKRGSRKRRPVYDEDDEDDEIDDDEDDEDIDDRSQRAKGGNNNTDGLGTHRKKQFSEDGVAVSRRSGGGNGGGGSHAGDVWDSIRANVQRSVKQIGEDRVLISLEIKVIPYERLQKQLDFSVCKLDWRLTLNDISKLICAKLLLNHTKYNPFVKLFTKQKESDSFFYPLDEKSSTIKSVDEQFWNVNRSKVEESHVQQSVQTQNRVLFYMIELKELPQSL